MQKIYLLVSTFMLGFEISYSQIEGCYISNDLVYASHFLCLKDDGTPTFVHVEIDTLPSCLDVGHPITFSKGFYTLSGDTILFKRKQSSFENFFKYRSIRKSNSIYEESYNMKGILKQKTITILDARDEPYLKLKKRKRFSLVFGERYFMGIWWLRYKQRKRFSCDVLMNLN